MRRTLRSQMEQIAQSLGLEPCPVRERLLRTLDDIELGDQQHDNQGALSFREEQQVADAPQQKRA